MKIKRLLFNQYRFNFWRVRKIAKSDYCIRQICLADCMEQLYSYWTYFHEILHLNIFGKSVEKQQVSLKSDKNNEYTTWRPTYIFITSRSYLLRMRNASNVLEKNKNTHYMFIDFFQNSHHLRGNVEKYCRAGRSDDNMANAHCIPDN